MVLKLQAPDCRLRSVNKLFACSGWVVIMALCIFLNTEADMGSSVLQVNTMHAPIQAATQRYRGGTEILGHGYPRAGFSVGFSLAAWHGHWVAQHWLHQEGSCKSSLKSACEKPACPSCGCNTFISWGQGVKILKQKRRNPLHQSSRYKFAFNLVTSPTCCFAFCPV